MTYDQRKYGSITINVGNSNVFGHVGHVIQEVPPALSIGAPITRERADGGMETTGRVRLSKIVSKLIVQAQSRTLEGMNVVRPHNRPTTMTNTVAIAGPDFVQHELENASGEYDVNIFTTDKETPKLAYKIEP
jgi:hypothetical protein